MINKIKLFGLNGYEAKVYHTLLKEGSLSAHLIAKNSGVPSGKIYPTLESLEYKGFISCGEGRPKIYMLRSPDTVFDRYLEHENKRLDDLKKNAKEIILNYQKLQVLKKEKPHDLIETYFGHSTAFARSITLHQQAEKYWKTISRLTINKEHLDACSNAIKRGVKILAMTSRKETTSTRVEEWRKRGVEVRFLEELPFRVSVYDNKGVIFRFAHEASKEYVSVHIKNRKLATGMNVLFDTFWKIAKE